MRPTNHDASLSFRVYNGEVFLDAYSDKENSNFASNENLKSILDMPGVTVVVLETTRDLGLRKVVEFDMKVKDGQFLSYKGPFERVQLEELPAYRFTFPASN